VLTTDDLRTRLQKQGWTIRELPVKSGGAANPTILSYKLIALKGDKSVTIGGKDLNDAFTNLSRTLGTIR
jgi:hypothetical protein